MHVVREVLEGSRGLNRAELARRVSHALDWRTVGGSYQYMSARVGMLRLARAGLIDLPKPRNSNGNGGELKGRKTHLPVGSPVIVSADRLAGLELRLVQSPAESALYNGMMAEYHYLGYRPMAGAQVRYLIGWAQGMLGAVSFGAAAWRLAARDSFIGWDGEQRQERLHLIVNNSRFLLLPWVRSPNLASKVLGMCGRRLGQDFVQRYGYRPVLAESFIEEGRFKGSCYRAANWQYLGLSQGRGKKGQWHEQRVPPKGIWVYPLHRRFRSILQGDSP